MDFKPLIRRALSAIGLNRTRAYIRFYRMVRGNENISHLLERERADRFARIYRTGVWLNGRASGSLSGAGSELQSTRNIRRELPAILRQLDVRSILDVGCGDWNWMGHVDLPCEYVGVDIVRSVIEANSARFSGPTRRFITLDAVEEPLPSCQGILCREVIFHLSFTDSRRLINNMLNSGASYLLATTDSDVEINADIRSGDFRPLNLCRRPFHFPEPLLQIAEDGVSKHRKLAVWPLGSLR